MQVLATVDVEHLTGDEGGVIRCQKEHRSDQISGNLVTGQRARLTLSGNHLLAKESVTALVRVRPGVTRFAVIPYWPTSRANARVNPMTPDLAAT